MLSEGKNWVVQVHSAERLKQGCSHAAQQDVACVVVAGPSRLATSAVRVAGASLSWGSSAAHLHLRQSSPEAPVPGVQHSSTGATSPPPSSAQPVASTLAAKPPLPPSPPSPPSFPLSTPGGQADALGGTSGEASADLPPPPPPSPTSLSSPGGPQAQKQQGDKAPGPFSFLFWRRSLSGAQGRGEGSEGGVRQQQPHLSSGMGRDGAAECSGGDASARKEGASLEEWPSATADEVFLLRSDDVLAGDMEIRFELLSASLPNATRTALDSSFAPPAAATSSSAANSAGLGKACLPLSQLPPTLMHHLDCGMALCLRLPLHPTLPTPAAASSLSTAAKSPTTDRTPTSTSLYNGRDNKGGGCGCAMQPLGGVSGQQGQGCCGDLVVSLWLQPCAAQMLPLRLPPELLPGISCDASKLAPASVLHTPVGHVYCDPCVVYLRVRLLGIVLSQAPGKSASKQGGKTPGKHQYPHPVQRHASNLSKQQQQQQLKGGLAGCGGCAGEGDEGASSENDGDGIGISSSSSVVGGSESESDGGSSSLASYGGASFAGFQSTRFGRGSGEKGRIGGSTGSCSSPAPSKVGSTYGTLTKPPASSNVAPDPLEVERVMRALEDGGLSAYDDHQLPLGPDGQPGQPFSGFWCKLHYEGQEHSTRMVQPLSVPTHPPAPAPPVLSRELLEQQNSLESGVGLGPQHDIGRERSTKGGGNASQMESQEGGSMMAAMGQGDWQGGWDGVSSREGSRRGECSSHGGGSGKLKHRSVGMRERGSTGDGNGKAAKACGQARTKEGGVGVGDARGEGVGGKEGEEMSEVLVWKNATTVMAAVRPVGGARPLEVELYSSKDPKSRGKSVCKLSLPLVQVLGAAGLHCSPQCPCAPSPSDKVVAPAPPSSAGHMAASPSVPSAGQIAAGSSSQEAGKGSTAARGGARPPGEAALATAAATAAGAGAAAGAEVGRARASATNASSSRAGGRGGGSTKAGGGYHVRWGGAWEEFMGGPAASWQLPGHPSHAAAASGSKDMSGGGREKQWDPEGTARKLAVAAAAPPSLQSHHDHPQSLPTSQSSACQEPHTRLNLQDGSTFTHPSTPHPHPDVGPPQTGETSHPANTNLHSTTQPAPHTPSHLTHAYSLSWQRAPRQPPPPPPPPPFYHPSSWPRGVAVMQETTSDNKRNTVSVFLGLEAVDADDRARVLGLPLLLPERMHASTGSALSRRKPPPSPVVIPHAAQQQRQSPCQQQQQQQQQQQPQSSYQQQQQQQQQQSPYQQQQHTASTGTNTASTHQQPCSETPLSNAAPPSQGRISPTSEPDVRPDLTLNAMGTSMQRPRPRETDSSCPPSGTGTHPPGRPQSSSSNGSTSASGLAKLGVLSSRGQTPAAAAEEDEEAEECDELSMLFDSWATGSVGRSAAPPGGGPRQGQGAGLVGSPQTHHNHQQPQQQQQRQLHREEAQARISGQSFVHQHQQAQRAPVWGGVLSPPSPTGTEEQGGARGLSQDSVRSKSPDMHDGQASAEDAQGQLREQQQQKQQQQEDAWLQCLLPQPPLHSATAALYREGHGQTSAAEAPHGRQHEAGSRYQAGAPEFDPGGCQGAWTHGQSSQQQQQQQHLQAEDSHSLDGHQPQVFQQQQQQQRHSSDGGSSSAGYKSPAKVMGSLDMVLHSVEFQSPPPEAGADCRVMFRLGSMWGVTSPLPASGLRSSSPSWRWHTRLPLTHPSQVMSLAVFQRIPDASIADVVGKKMLSGMRSVIGLPSVGGATIPSHSPPLPPSSFAFDPELALLGKLRLRTSTIPATSFAPPGSSRPSPATAESGLGLNQQRATPRASRTGNRLKVWSAVASASVEAMLLQAVGAGRVSGGIRNGLHVTVSLPIASERQQNKGPAVAGHVHLTLVVSYPEGLWPVLGTYMSPHTYEPVLLMQQGATAGDDLRSPYLGCAHLKANADELQQKATRVTLGWLSASVTPAVPPSAARCLIDDGRQEFMLSRTQQNWKRLAGAVGSVQPILAWWKKVQSWEHPLMSSMVAAVVVACAYAPTLAFAGSCFAAALYMAYLKVYIIDASQPQPPLPPSMLPDLTDEPADTATPSAAAPGMTAADDHGTATRNTAGMRDGSRASVSGMLGVNTVPTAQGWPCADPSAVPSSAPSFSAAAAAPVASSVRAHSPVSSARPSFSSLAHPIGSMEGGVQGGLLSFSSEGRVGADSAHSEFSLRPSISGVPGSHAGGAWSHQNQSQQQQQQLQQQQVQMEREMAAADESSGVWFEGPRALSNYYAEQSAEVAATATTASTTSATTVAEVEEPRAGAAVQGVPDAVGSARKGGPDQAPTTGSIAEGGPDQLSTTTEAAECVQQSAELRVATSATSLVELGKEHCSLVEVEKEHSSLVEVGKEHSSLVERGKPPGAAGQGAAAARQASAKAGEDGAGATAQAQASSSVRSSTAPIPISQISRGHVSRHHTHSPHSLYSNNNSCSSNSTAAAAAAGGGGLSLGSSAPSPSPSHGALRAGVRGTRRGDTENGGVGFVVREGQERGAVEGLEGGSFQGAPTQQQQQQQQQQQEDGCLQEAKETAPSSSQISQGGPQSCQASSTAANSMPATPSQPPVFAAIAAQAGLAWGGLGDWMRKGVNHVQGLHQMHKARVAMRASSASPGGTRAGAANDVGTAEGDGAISGAAAAASAAAAAAAAPHTSWEVPLDPIASMRSQYEALMRFMLMIQNILDSLATSAERLHALLTWQDPLASMLAVVSLVASGLCVSMLGLPGLVAAMVLIDMRPPPLRDPFPVPTENLMRALPSRADHMM